MGNSALKETRLIDGALRSVEALLPDSWRLDVEADVRAASLRADAIAKLAGPDGSATRFIVEARRSGTSNRLVLARVRELATASELPLLYVSDYLGPTLREALAAEGISYADETGWVRISTVVPLILLTGHGAARSPRDRGSTAVERLNGIAAGRIIRSLCVQEPPLGVRVLASLAGVSPGSVSKVLPTLVGEGVLDRDGRGAVTVVRRRALIRRWAQDYSFHTTNGAPRHYIAPRGLTRTLEMLADLPSPVTLTGSAAARRRLPEAAISVVPLRLLALYADDPGALADTLGLLPTDPATANVIVAIPQDRGVLAGHLAPAALVLADLLTLPGRADAEAEQFMDALARTDPAWRE